MFKRFIDFLFPGAGDPRTLTRGDLVLDNGLALLKRVLLIYLVCIIFLSTPSNYYNEDYSASQWIADWLASIGIISLVCGAALFIGTFLGFLFGIPRSLRSDNPNPESNEGYSDNTNLEQISDWLTKIIVGVSLIEFNRISETLDTMASECAKAFLFSPDIGYVIAYSSIIVFWVCGFLFCYLWTRVRLKQVFTGLNKSIGEIKEQIDEISKRNIDKLRKYFRDWEDKVLPEKLRNNLPEIKIEDDPQRLRFGGRPSIGEYALSATVTPLNGLKYSIAIVINVPISNIQPVYIYLHDSFEAPIVELIPENGKVEYVTQAYEAFTVGAICNDGKTLLELDMNKIESPSGFKYP